MNTPDTEQVDTLTAIQKRLTEAGLGHVYDALLDPEVYTQGTAHRLPRLNRSAVARKLGIGNHQMAQLWSRIKTMLIDTQHD